jgi:D-sedoheptulose 7-phosphate isomerase
MLKLATHPVATEYLANVARAIELVPHDALERAIELVLEARAAHRRIYAMGNGGSAATASHFVCDLVKTAHVAGTPAVRAFALADNVPLLTAWANDCAYERVFAEQVIALVEPGDVVFAISASGRSPNIVAGLSAAADRGARTVGLVGFDGGSVRGMVDVAIHIPAHSYGLVEDVHSAIGHAIAWAVRMAIQSAEGA